MEFFDILDENGNKTGKIKERSLVHEDGDIHGTVHIWIRRKTEKGYDLLLQKRSKEKTPFQAATTSHPQDTSVQVMSH